jgi:hypothetical protein
MDNRNKAKLGAAVLLFVGFGVVGYLAYQKSRKLWEKRPVETRMVIVRADGSEDVLWSKPMLRRDAELGTVEDVLE